MMTWVVLAIVVVVIGTAAAVFYRWSSRVDSELRAEGISPAPFNFERRAVDRRATALSHPGEDRDAS